MGDTFKVSWKYKFWVFRRNQEPLKNKSRHDNMVSRALCLNT